MVPVTPSLPTVPTNVGIQIEASFRVWIRTLKQTWSLAVLPAVLALLPTLFVPRNDDPFLAFDATLAWLQQPGTWAMVALVMLMQVLFLSALVYRIGHCGRGDDPGFAASLSAGLQRLPASIAGWLLYGGVLIVGLLPSGALCVYGFLDSTPVLLRAIALLGALALLAPATWYSLAAGFFLFASVLEGLGPIDAQRRSLALVRGRWWPASAVVGTGLLIYSMIAGAVGSVVFMFAFALQFALGGAESLLGAGWLILTQWLIAPFSALSQVLVVAALLVAFNDLVLRRADHSAA